MKRHLDWWLNKIGKYGLTKISSDLVAQFRQELAEGLTSKKTKRSHATVSRYLATSSAVELVNGTKAQNPTNIILEEIITQRDVLKINMALV